MKRDARSVYRRSETSSSAMALGCGFEIGFGLDDAAGFAEGAAGFAEGCAKSVAKGGGASTDSGEASFSIVPCTGGNGCATTKDETERVAIVFTGGFTEGAKGWAKGAEGFTDDWVKGAEGWTNGAEGWTGG